jgi:hypothetical protein
LLADAGAVDFAVFVDDVEVVDDFLEVVLDFAGFPDVVVDVDAFGLDVLGFDVFGFDVFGFDVFGLDGPEDDVFAPDDLGFAAFGLPGWLGFGAEALGADDLPAPTGTDVDL